MMKDKKTILELQTEKRVIEFDEYVDQLKEFDKPVISVWENNRSESILLTNEEIDENPIIEDLNEDQSNLISKDLSEYDFSDDNYQVEYFEEPKESEIQSESEKLQQDNPLVNVTEIAGRIDEFSEVIGNRFTSVEEQIGKLKRDFETKIMLDVQKDQIIDSLHRELQIYKNNENQDRFLPLIRDLISLIDTIEKQCAHIEKKGMHDPEKLLKIIKDTAQDVEDILYRQGVEVIPVQHSKFDAKQHKVVKSIRTNNKEKDRHIAAVTGRGYSWDKRLIRQEHVAVYVYDPELEE